MNTARQIIRWAIPGWLTIMFFISFVVITLLVNSEWDQLTFVETSFLSHFIGVFIPIGIIAIPFGFVIFQLYYWMYWHAPVPSFAQRFIFSNDRARDILGDVEDHPVIKRKFHREIVKGADVAYERGKPFRSSKIMDNYRENWSLLESIWYYCLNKSKYENVKNYLEVRVQCLSDIYHSLGASMVSLVGAYTLFLVWFFSNYDLIHNIWHLGAFILDLFIGFSTFFVLFKCRKGCYDVWSSIKRDFINSVLL